MRADERELAASRLRQIASGVGLDLDDTRLERLMGLLESTVDGTREAAELVPDGAEPALVSDVDPETVP